MRSGISEFDLHCGKGYFGSRGIKMSSGIKHQKESKMSNTTGQPVSFTDTPLTLGTPKPNNMTFHASDGTLVATLDFNGPELVFTGNADEAAKIFVQAVGKYMQERLNVNNKEPILSKVTEPSAVANDIKRYATLVDYLTGNDTSHDDAILDAKNKEQMDKVIDRIGEDKCQI